MGTGLTASQASWASRIKTPKGIGTKGAGSDARA